MPRIRTIKPAFFKSLTIGQLPKTCRLTFIGLWTYVDDAGRAPDDLRLIKGEIWPLDDDYTLKKIEADLCILDAAGLIERYAADDGRRYLRIVNWREHQVINRPQPSKLPAPIHGMFTELSGITPGMFTDHSSKVVSGKGREGKGIPPTPHDAAAPSPNGDEVKTDGNAQQLEKPDPPPPFSKKAVALVDRWLTIVEDGHKPLQRIDAEKLIPHLLDHIDHNALDEILGRCAAEPTPPRRAKYLLIAARRWANDHGVTIPDPTRAP